MSNVCIMCRPAITMLLFFFLFYTIKWFKQSSIESKSYSFSGGKKPERRFIPFESVDRLLSKSLEISWFYIVPLAAQCGEFFPIQNAKCACELWNAVANDPPNTTTNWKTNYVYAFKCENYDASNWMKVNRSELIKLIQNSGFDKELPKFYLTPKLMAKINQDVVIYWRFSYLLWVIIYLNTAKWTCQQQFWKMIYHMNYTYGKFGIWLWLWCRSISGFVLTTKLIRRTFAEMLYHFIFRIVQHRIYLTKLTFL